MSRKIVKKEYTNTYLATEEIRCGCCGKAAPNPTDYDESVWGEGADTIGVQIKTWEGSSCADGGHKQTKSYDLCPDCFKKHILSVLENLKVEPFIKESDW